MKKLLALSALTMFGFSLMASAITNVCVSLSGTAYTACMNDAGAGTGGSLSNNVSQGAGANVLNIITQTQDIVSQLAPLGISLAVVALFYGIVMFIFKKDDAEAHDKWLKFMGMAILGLFVMVSVWGLVSFIGGMFGVAQGGGIATPALPTKPLTY